MSTDDYTKATLTSATPEKSSQPQANNNALIRQLGDLTVSDPKGDLDPSGSRDMGEGPDLSLDLFGHSKLQ